MGGRRGTAVRHIGRLPSATPHLRISPIFPLAIPNAKIRTSCMNYRLILLLIPIVSILLSDRSAAQHLVASGGMTAEAAIVVGRDRVFVGYKNDELTERPADAVPGQIYRVVEVPLNASRLSFNGDRLRGELRALSFDGKSLWKRSYGKSRNSEALAMASDGAGGLFVAAPATDVENAIVIEHLDGDGKVLWSRQFDSVNTASSLFADARRKYVSVLAWHQKTGLLRMGDTTSTAKEFYTAARISLDRETGENISFEGDAIPAWDPALSSLRTDGGFQLRQVDHAQWITWGQGFPLLFAYREEDSTHIVQLPLIDEVSSTRIVAGAFRDGSYAVAGPDSATNVMEVALIGNSDADGLSGKATSVRDLEGKAESSLHFNDRGSITLAIATEGRLRFIDYDTELRERTDTTITIAGSEQSALASCTSAGEGVFDLLYVTQVGEERKLWWRRVDIGG